MSVICRPDGVEGLECLSLRSGLAVARGLETTLPGLGPLTVKWPNDVLLDGRKLAGILCESRWDGPRLGWVVVGVGINVSNSIPGQLSHTAIRLTDRVTPIPLDRLAEVVRLGVASAGRWAGVLTEEEMAEFARLDMLAGRAVTAPIAGWAAGITPAGSLRIRTETGLIREVTAGDAVVLA